MDPYYGWDIGGVHLKFARLTTGPGPTSIATRVEPFEIWKNVRGLVPKLRSLMDGPPGTHAVTMTAELSDVFEDKPAGVRTILRACAEALPGPPRVLDVRGRFLPLEEGLRRPLDVAAANWMGTARLAARVLRDALLIDIGSTTTDIVPIRAGEPSPAGRTDTERLSLGELVYTGVLRTPPAALAETVPLGGDWCRVSSESFTNMGDVHLILGEIAADDYSVATPDGRGRSRNEAMARLARLVCADLATIGHAAVETMARYLKERQIERVAEGIRQVLSRREDGTIVTAITAGAGAFLAEDAARRAGLETTRLADLVPGVAPGGWARAAPAAAIAVLLADECGAFRFTV